MFKSIGMAASLLTMAILLPTTECQPNGQVPPPRGMYATGEVIFKIKFNVFTDTLIYKIFLYIIQINDFPGDLSDISAKKNFTVRHPDLVFWTIFQSDHSENYMFV